MRFRLLGPLEVTRSGEVIDVGSPKQRAVLALLVLNRGRVVSTDRLVDAVWGEEPPPSGTASLQAYISNLRRALRGEASAASSIVRRSPGYVLDVAAAQIDITDFLGTAEAAQRSADEGDWEQVLDLTESALALWRGPFLDDLRDEQWVEIESRGLEEIRTETREMRVTALLAHSRIAPALVELRQLRSGHPFRERTCWLHMLALHHARRSSEALEEFRRYAARLDDELGLEPGVELRELQGSILRHDPALAGWPRSPQWTGATQVHAPPDPAATLHGLDEGETSPPNPLIGRAREIAVIDRLLDHVREGATRWLVLTGPAGIGKTRLAEEAVRRLQGSGGRQVWARCPEEAGAPAWWPIRQIVHGLGAEPDTVLVPPVGIDSDEARFAVYERVQRLVIEHCSTHPGPLAIVLDDVQWADATSIGCLTYLAGALRDRPVLLVVTQRDEGSSSALKRLFAGISRTAGNGQILVPVLAVADVGSLASQISGEVFSAGEVALLSERTGGNPLFVSEYARLPREERVADSIPVAIRSVLDRRLAALDLAALQVIGAAAVIGDVLEVDILAATTGLDLDTLADHLDEAADERIIVAAPGIGGYTFAHGLLREEVLVTMSALRRQRLHARVAEVLAGASGSGRLSQRAQHLISALPLVDPAEVVEACRIAARDAADQWSSEVAAHWWQAGLEAYDLLPSEARTEQARDDLLVQRVEALARAGRSQAVLDVVETGLSDAMRKGGTAAVGRLAAALLRTAGAWPWMSPGSDPGPLLERLSAVESFVVSDRAAHIRVLAALAVGNCYHPDPAEPDGLSRTAIEMAEELGDPDVLADALLGRIITYSGVATHSREVLTLTEQLIGLPHAQHRVDEVISRGAASMAHFNLGDVDGAVDDIRRGIAGSEVLRLPVLRVQFRWMEASIASWRGDFDEALRQCRTAKQFHQQTELYEAGSMDLALRAVDWEQGRLAEVDTSGLFDPIAWDAAIAADRGNSEVSIRVLRQWLGRRRPHVWTTLGHQVLLAHVAADLHVTDAAEQLLELLLPFEDRIANVGQVGALGSVALACARLCIVLDDETQARRLLGLARRLAEETRARPTLLRCRFAAAQLLGPGPEQVAELSIVAEEAARLGMRGLEAQARRGEGAEPRA